MGLKALDPGGAQYAAEERVFGEVLEVAATQGAALDVDSRAEQDVHAVCEALAAECATHALGQVGVPAARQRDRGREAGCGALPLMPRWSARSSSCRRSPCGPSERRISGIPACGKAPVAHQLAPVVRAAFSSRVSRAVASWAAPGVAEIGFGASVTLSSLVVR